MRWRRRWPAPCRCATSCASSASAPLTLCLHLRDSLDLAEPTWPKGVSRDEEMVGSWCGGRSPDDVARRHVCARTGHGAPVGRCACHISSRDGLRSGAVHVIRHTDAWRADGYGPGCQRCVLYRPVRSALVHGQQRAGAGRGHRRNHDGSGARAHGPGSFGQRAPAADPRQAAVGGRSRKTGPVRCDLGLKGRTDEGRGGRLTCPLSVGVRWGTGVDREGGADGPPAVGRRPRGDTGG